MKNIILENDGATKKLGQEISEIIKKSDNQNIEIHLQGDLGAGKTFITRSIIKNCGWGDLVKSPTYTLCEEYDLDGLLFLHIDLYRTNEAQDIDIFNLDRVLNKKKIVLIEWPDRLQLERKYDLKIDFFHLENKRKINIIYGTDVFKTLEAKYE
jgi:tRNA threonylcarbamoyladenosine biosynthesis protein TsaE